MGRNLCLIKNYKGECPCTAPHKKCEDSVCPYTDDQLYQMYKEKESEKNLWNRK